MLRSTLLDISSRLRSHRPTGSGERRVRSSRRRSGTNSDGMVELAFVYQGYTGDEPAKRAAEQGIDLKVIKLPQAKKGFVLLPRRWVVERNFA